MPPLARYLMHLAELRYQMPCSPTSTRRWPGLRGEQDEGWMAFFTPNALSASTGIVYGELAQVVDPRYACLAVLLLTAAVDGYGDDMTRSRAFSLISLAACHLIDDRVDAGVEAGECAVELCERLGSHRTVERLRQLRNEVERRRSHRGARELADRIRAFRPPSSVEC
ncbi:hypothetical protein AB0K14_23700 [Actinosynnema sp. NPDC050801]|uniref:CATRA conflict system CASPASE/TPR repeat-associated protein n=1 Tax=unclassified Actinosynnema TaxID=2637065 RepID=UPI0033D7ACFE